MTERRLVASWRFEDGSSIEVVAWNEPTTEQVLWFVETWLDAKRTEIRAALEQQQQKGEEL